MVACFTDTYYCNICTQTKQANGYTLITTRGDAENTRQIPVVCNTAAPIPAIHHHNLIHYKPTKRPARDPQCNARIDSSSLASTSMKKHKYKQLSELSQLKLFKCRFALIYVDVYDPIYCDSVMPISYSLAHVKYGE